MLIRPLRPSDVESAKGLLHQLDYDLSADDLARRIDRVLASKSHYAVVAEDGEKVVGLVHAYERPALEKPCEVVVQSLVVDSSLRKAGIGKILMAAAEAWARTRGLTHVVLHMREDRDDARAFYEHLGYRKVATSHLMRNALEGA